MPDAGRVFLSYNRRDQESVERIRQQLGSIPVFLDRENLESGVPWASALDRALASASSVVVFLGSAGVGGWQEREMYFALDRQVEEQKVGKRFPVIPVLLEGADPALAPGFLKQNTWIDLRRGPADGEALAALVRALTDQVSPEAPAGENICPYRGLRPFRQEHAGFFFGRGKFIRSLAAKVLERQILAVVGASGSGKSSVVLAGLWPQLHALRPPQPTWESVVFTPGGHPWRALADVLTPRLGDSPADLAADLLRGHGALESAVKRILTRTDAADRLLLVVDQFEELFTLAASEVRLPFVESLLSAARSCPLHLVFTLRADFYSQAIQTSRELSDAFSEGQVNIGALTRDEVREAIEEPAYRVGLRFERGLADAILRDVAGQPGNLPLLEYALTSLWEKREGNRLTHDAYQGIGGVAGAIVTRAEEVYLSLTADQQKKARLLLERLVRPARASEEGTDTRRRAGRAEFDDATWEIALRFAAPGARLLVVSSAGGAGADDQTVEVAHETLLTNWKRLRDWIEEDRDFLLWRAQLRHFLEPWVRSGRSGKELLLRGPLLQEARTWYHARREALDADERLFIQRNLRASARGRFLASAAAVLALLILSGAAGWLLYTRSALYQIQQIVWSARDANEEYVVALGLCGQTEAPRPSEASRNLQEWAERYWQRWTTWLNLDVAPTIHTPLLRGLLLGGHVDRAVTLAESRGLPCDWSFLAREAARLGQTALAAGALKRAQQQVSADSRPETQLSSYGCVGNAAISLGDTSLEKQAFAGITGLLDRPGVTVDAGSEAALLFLARSGHLDHAVRALQHAADEQQIRNTWPRVFRALASEAIADRRPEEARIWIQKIGDGWPRDDALVELAGFQTTRGEFDQAKQTLRQIKEPHKREYGLRELFAVLVDAGKVDEALELAAGLPSANLSGLLMLLARRGRFDELNRILNNYSAPPDFFPQLVTAYVRHGRYQQAEELAKKFSTRYYPNQWQYYLAAAYFAAGDWESGNQLSRDLKPDHLAQGAVETGVRTRIEAGDLDGAWRDLDRLASGERLAAAPPVFEALLQAGRGQDAAAVAARLYPDLGAGERMLRLAENVVRNPTPASRLERLAVNLDQSGFGDAADWMLKSAWQAISRSRSDSEAAQLAAVNARLGRFREARQIAESCSEARYRLYAFTAILTAYGTRNNPELRARLDAEGFPHPPGEDRSWR